MDTLNKANIRGLSQEEVEVRINKGQCNTTTTESTRSYRGIILSNLFSLLNLTIFVIAAVLINLYFVFNEIKTVYDALSISTVALVNSLVGTIQEIRAKHALEKIVALAKPTVTVLRAQKLEEIHGDSLVLDDVIKITRGDQVPVDAIVLESNACEIDESLLTGESDYLRKDATQEVLSGSFCVAGSAFIKATRVGAESYIHKLTTEAKDYKRFFSPLQQKINILVKIGVTAAVLMVLMIAVDTLIDKLYWQQVPDWIALVRKFASLVTALIPIGLILLSSVAFALGVIRISKKGALVQKLNAIESFAHVTTICMDKTGTLTQNKLYLHEVIPIGKHDISNIKKTLGTWAHKASDQNPTSIAIKKECGSYEGKIVDEIPFNSKNKYSALALDTEEFGRMNIFFGAFETLKPYLSESECILVTQKLKQQKQYRNLVLAELPQSTLGLKENLENKTTLTTLAVVSLVDEIRPNIEKVLNHFYKQKIHLKIVSGDAPETVQSVAERAGWKENLQKVITGSELDKMNTEELDRAAKENSLFARVSPQNKKDIITSLQRQKEYVSMIGDGVNDVLALKQAELGVAMNAGNRMSKDVSDIILLENDFTVMPEVFKEGHTILGNISSSAKLFLTKNVYAAFLITFCAFLGLSFPLVPRHVTMMGLFTITIPALLITFTKRLKYNPHNFLKEILTFTLITGLVVSFAGTMTLYLSQNYFLSDIETARTAMLTQIIILTLLNFIIVLNPKHPLKLIQEAPYLLVFVLLFLGLYFVTLWTVTNFESFNKIGEFLELKALHIGHYLMIGVISLVAGTAMIIAHKWKAKDY